MIPRLKAWGESKIVPIAVGIVLNERGEILLLKRHTDDLGGNKWTTPGGRIDENELPIITVERELFEETGLQLPNFTHLGAHTITMPHGTVLMYSYSSEAPSNSVIKLDPVEHSAHGWFALDTLLEMDDVIWGLPTVLHDFNLLSPFSVDTTLKDGSTVQRATAKL